MTEVQKLNTLMSKLIEGANEALESDHLSVCAKNSGFEQARLNIRRQVKAQREAFVQIQRLLNGEDGRFSDCGIPYCTLEDGTDA